MNGWNYDIENVPEGDARKIVTLEQDGMVWVGIRAYHHVDKKWLNNGTETTERVVAWQDMPTPANPRYFALPKEMLDEFEAKMRDEVIPQIEQDIHDRVERAAEARRRFLWR